MNANKVLQFSIGPIVGALLGLITLPIVTWFFSPEDIGRLTMLQVATSFSLLFFSIGLDQAYVREFHEVEDKAVLLKSVVAPGLVILVFVVAILSLLPYSISYFLFGIESVYLTILMIISVFFSFASRFMSLILRMQERGLAYSMSQVLSKLLFLMIVGSYVLLSFDTIFDNLIMAHVLSLFVVLTVFAWNTRFVWMLAISARIDKDKLAQMVRYAIPLIGGGLAFWGLTAMDKFFLRTLSSFEELAVYSVSVSFAGSALVFQAIFSTIWAPIVYKWVAIGIDASHVKNVIDKVSLGIMVIWSLAGMFSWTVIYILPEEYAKVQIILLAAMAYPLLYTLSEATGVGISVKRKTIYSFLSVVVSLIVNGLGNYALIPKYGASGAAISSAIAFLLFFILKTEFSYGLWESFGRVSMYLLVLCALVLSVISNLIEINVFYRITLWLCLIVLTFIIYRKSASEIFLYLKTHMQGNL